MSTNKTGIAGWPVACIDVARRILRAPFLYALIPSLLFYTVILSRNWIPIHDSFYVLNFTHFLFNEVLSNHEIPLWYPYIQLGLDTNWFLSLTIGPSLAMLLAGARVIGVGDFLHYYYLSMFLDELILVVGTYLLARKLFRSSLTTVFVCIAMTGSTLWFAQPFFNFHMYYFVPLAAYFIVTGCEKQVIWRILAAGLVLLVSAFGNAWYFLVVLGLTFVLLFAGSWWAYGFNCAAACRRVGARELAVFATCALTIGLYLVFLTYGVDHIIYNIGRTHKGLVDANVFLSYGGGIGLAKFSELFTGTSWNIDINVYAGVLVFSSVVFGLVWAPERRMTPFLLTAIFLTLLSLGKDSFIAQLFYEVPGVAYYRHIGLLLPLIKVMLIVLAGFGFDALVRVGVGSEDTSESRLRKAYLTNVVILLVMLLIGCVLVYLSMISRDRFNAQIIFPSVTTASTKFEKIPELLGRFAFVALVYASVVVVMLMGRIRGRAVAGVVGIALLVIQGIDVYSYRMSQFNEHMVTIGDDYRKLFAFGSKPYAAERTRNPMKDERFRIVATSFSKKIEPDWYDKCTKATNEHCYYSFLTTKEGAYYNTVEPFVGVDSCRSVFRSDYWISSIDLFYRSATGMRLHDWDAKPKGFEQGKIYYPINDMRVAKQTGCEFPKLQLFLSPTVIQDEQEMARFMRDPKYRGDLLLVSGADFSAYRKLGGSELTGIGDRQEKARPDGNSRVQGEVRIMRATANTLAVSTKLPEPTGKYWLYLADAWHPFWHAKVNGVETPIIRANFGFKAVEIPGGAATVVFEYRSGVLSAAIALTAIVLISAMLIIILTAARLLLRP